MTQDTQNKNTIPETNTQQTVNTTSNAKNTDMNNLFDDLPVPEEKQTDATEKTTPNTLTNIKAVDIVISGATYTINCPVNEQDALIRASDYINNTIKDIRRSAPALSHENLLVLCCLNMFGQMDKISNKQKSAMVHEQAVQKLLDKISKEAASILPT